MIRFLKCISPSALGLLDVITDILYITTENFFDGYIWALWIFFLLFSPFLQFIVWAGFFAKLELTNVHSNKIYNKYEE